MLNTRIYQDTPFSLNQTFALTKEASHHLARVLRASLNDTLTLFNGDGFNYTAVITDISKNATTVTIQDKTCNDTESPVAIHLVQGVSRGDKMDFCLQKAVELGVTSITPLLTERCGVKLTKERFAKKLQHWEGVINSACEQSGRSVVPQLHPIASLSEYIKTFQASLNHTALLCHPSPSAAHQIMLRDIPETNTSFTLLIGPEGGFSDSEVQAAIQHGFQCLTLGKRVLRTETAALAVIAALQVQSGDFS